MRRYLAISGVTICVAAVAAAAAYAAVKPNAKYTGETSQGKRVDLRTSPTGGSVKGFVITRVLKCAASSGTQKVRGTFRQTSGQMVIKADGSFAGGGKVTPTAGGTIKRGVFSLKGRFGPRGRAARGTYRERVRLGDGTRCDTGKIRYRVSLPGERRALQL
jgi:hypothetical protein